MEKSNFNYERLVLVCMGIWLLTYCSVTRTITDDESALLSFKAHITADPHNVLADNWSTNISVCQWIGVACGVSHERVRALNLSGLSLRGTISPYLGNLSFLTSLDITSNYFHGTIPEELRNLRRIKKLHLHSNNFVGEVPSWLGTLQQLKHLILSNNSFKGTIPALICNNISKLGRLHLHLNQLSGQIPTDLYKCKELQVLTLSANELTGSIPREIGNLTLLKEIYLGGNNFEGATIPREIGNLKHLEILSIKNAILTGPIPSCIFNMSSLKSIYLYNNSLSGNLPMDIYYNLPRLEELYLANNQLAGRIPSGLWDCKELRVLHLESNIFTGSISKKIGNLTLLQYLYLDRNNLGGTLPDEIGNLNLKVLNVYENILTGVIPLKIFNSSTLKDLKFQSNNLSGHLPSTVGLWLPNLELFYSSDNRLGGRIPISLTNASKLIVISMENNLLTGSIPNTLGKLRFLEWLHLPGNSLTRETFSLELQFFSSLTNCRYLQVLQLSENQLNGILPTSIGNLSSSLKWFGAYDSKIKGKIPNGIGNLSNLQIINLSNNELTGPIPTSFKRLNQLERLILSNNRLQGPVSNNFCQLKVMGELYLSVNRLHGSIPICLGDLKYLRRLYLDSNNLSSTIPSIFSRLSDLVSLNLSSNFLQGYVPSSIGSLKIATDIDLSWNQLSGDIPNTIGGAQELANLSLAHNNLQGSIPESVSNLKGLEFLDLSNNNLSGVIPKSLETFRYLQYLNLSSNMLQGEIPSGGPFANFTAQSFLQNLGLCGSPQFQVPACKKITLKGSGSKIVHLLAYILPSVVSAILLGGFIYVIIRLCKRNMTVPPGMDSSPFSWRRISYYELVRATESFSETNLLGTGSYGSVFKGALFDGMNVAIKVFNMQLEGAIKSFDVESEILCKIRHRNLVRIITCCSNSNFKALVLEYMPNGSLEKWIYSHNYYLDILQRLNIMIDVASALKYLHHGLSEPVVHCDLKPSNVLLDEDMTAHVCDFGIAKLIGEEEFMARTKTLGTIGYIAPEYGQEGVVSTKGDVYSFGITLMETFTRKKPTDDMFSSEINLRRWVNEALRGSVLQVIEINLLGGEKHSYAKEQCISSILHLALDCSTDSPALRITMEEVVVQLEKIKVMLQTCS